MAENVNTGYLTTNRSNAPDVKTRAVDKEILMRQPEETPFYVFASKIGAKGVPQMKFEWSEDDVLTPVVTNQDAVSDDTTNVTITFKNSRESYKVRRGAILMNNTTGQKYFVLDKNDNTNTALLQRNLISTLSNAIAANEELVLVTETFEEGVRFSDAITREPELFYNYLQEFEEPIQMTNIQMTTEEYTTNSWKHQNDMAQRRYKQRRERSWWGGSRLTTTGPSGAPVFATGGMDEFIANGPNAAENYVTVTGALTLKTLQNWAVRPLTFGRRNTKMLFGSPSTWNSLSQVIDGYETVSPSEKTLGMTVQILFVNGVRIKFVENQEFERMNWNDRLYLVDMSLVGKRYLAGNGFSFDVKLLRNVQENDRKGRKDVIYGIEGLMRKNSDAHACLKGFRV